ncbi:hypothetical protein GCK32_019687 [Trichostrongylus colubriformis]|uniref:Dehydrogenase E1 component domain-containing protein n=1 Tax=Trichostrongylus colubriformis TaxID=6319 RepID=A0AAN8EWM9_TRICO
MGKARARARSLGVGDYSTDRSARTGDGVLAVLVHGDGAFTGQGIVWESISLSQVPHFRLGGSIHLITNNQVAFTAESHIGRSTIHCTGGFRMRKIQTVLRIIMDYPQTFFAMFISNLISNWLIT